MVEVTEVVEVDVPAGSGVGVGVDVVAVTGSDAEVGADADTGAFFTAQVPSTTGSGSAIRAASRSEVTYPS